MWEGLTLRRGVLEGSSRKPERRCRKRKAQKSPRIVGLRGESHERVAQDLTLPGGRHGQTFYEVSSKKGRRRKEGKRDGGTTRNDRHTNLVIVTLGEGRLVHTQEEGEPAGGISLRKRNRGTSQRDSDVRVLCKKNMG